MHHANVAARHRTVRPTTTLGSTTCLCRAQPSRPVDEGSEELVRTFPRAEIDKSEADEPS